MKLGLGSYAYRWSIGHKDRVPSKPLDCLELLDITSKLGLGVLQIADNMPVHNITNQTLDNLSESAKSRGIDLEIGLQSFSPETTKEYLQIAERLDAKILRIALDGNDVQTSDDNIAREFKNILPIAEKIKCKLAIENHFAFPSTRMANIIKLVDHDYLGACLDVANSICAGEWPDETIDCLADHTINLHIKDYHFKLDPYGVGFCIEGAPMGDGLTNIQSLLSKFIDKEISVLYEHWLPWPGNFKDAKKNEDKWTAKGASYLTSMTSELIQNQ